MNDVASTDRQATERRVLRWIEVVGSTTLGRVVVRGLDDPRQWVLSRVGLFSRFRG